jgi:glycosyltransferase involved in cell wall biosynthesis
MMGPLTIYHTEASMGWGGQEIRILSEMTALQDRGYRLGLITQPGAEIAARVAAAGFKVHHVRMRGAVDFLAVAQVAGILRGAQARLVNTHSSVDAWVAGWAARLVRIPVLRTRHLAIPLKRQPLAPRVYTWMADRVVTTGEAGRRLLLEQADVVPDRVTVVPTGVDVTHFDPGRVDGLAARRALGLLPEAPVIGIVAVLRLHKGHIPLLRAMATPSLADRKVQLLIAGSGPMGDYLRDLAGSLGIASRVHFLGHREDVPEILAASDVVVLPSTRDEGVPQTILQAFALERPVVASDVAGIRQVVRDGETGLLVYPEDPDALAKCIVRLLDTPALGRALGTAGRALVCAEHSVERMADAMERVYRALLGEACESSA